MEITKPVISDVKVNTLVDKESKKIKITCVDIKKAKEEDNEDKVCPRCDTGPCLCNK